MEHILYGYVCWCICAVDRPLIVQFAASNARDFADATEIVAPYVSFQFVLDVLYSETVLWIRQLWYWKLPLEFYLAISELWFGQEWEGILLELLCSSSIV